MIGAKRVHGQRDESGRAGQGKTQGHGDGVMSTILLVYMYTRIARERRNERTNERTNERKSTFKKRIKQRKEEEKLSRPGRRERVVVVDERLTRREEQKGKERRGRKGDRGGRSLLGMADGMDRPFLLFMIHIINYMQQSLVCTYTCTCMSSFSSGSLEMGSNLYSGGFKIIVIYLINHISVLSCTASARLFLSRPLSI